MRYILALLNIGIFLFSINGIWIAQKWLSRGDILYAERALLYFGLLCLLYGITTYLLINKKENPLIRSLFIVFNVAFLIWYFFKISPPIFAPSLNYFRTVLRILPIFLHACNATMLQRDLARY